MQFAILGVPLRVEATEPELLILADRALGGWRIAESAGASSASASLVMRLSRGGLINPARRDIVVHLAGELLAIQIGNDCGWADPSVGRAGARLSPDAICRPHETTLLLETLAVYLAQTTARPVVLHAAALVTGGRSILVTGADGAGKSTLTYAWVRSGRALVAEDACFSTGPSDHLSVWGAPWRIHLLPDSVPLFPELLGSHRTRMLNGEEKIVVPVCPEQCLTHAEVAGVIRLERSDGQSEIVPVTDLDDVAETLILRGGPERCLDETRKSARELVRGPVATLRFGSDIGRAVELVSQWAERL